MNSIVNFWAGNGGCRAIGHPVRDEMLVENRHSQPRSHRPVRDGIMSLTGHTASLWHRPFYQHCVPNGTSRAIANNNNNNNNNNNKLKIMNLKIVNRQSTSYFVRSTSKIVNFLLLVAITLLTFPSCDFLNVDDYFNETFKYDSLFVNKENFERYLFATAANFPDEAESTLYQMGPHACDEAFHIDNRFLASGYVLGEHSPTNDAMGKWTDMYRIIRKANTLLANINKPADMTTLDRSEMLGYIYFMRAYSYYRLLMQYGPVVILGDDVLETNEESAYYDRARETFDNSVDYICDELERAANFLPREVSFSHFGRPTRGAALGLVARLRLNQASPLWNGREAARRTFGLWRRSTDNQHYVSQEYDESKWATAAMACKRIIDMNVYTLHTVPKMPDTPPLPDNVSNLPFPDGAGDIDPFRSYSDMFTGEMVPQRNPEFLFAKMSSHVDEYTRHCFPYNILNGSGRVSIPQKVVDAYRMKDGSNFGDNSDYPTTGTIGGSNRIFSGYRLNSTAHNMYANREMRFYASIAFSQGYWFCNSNTNPQKRGVTISFEPYGNGGKYSIGNSTTRYFISGYTLKKFTHEDDSWGDAAFGSNYQGARRVVKSFPMVRYAEILLAYVEALNNLTPGVTHSVDAGDGNTVSISRDIAEMRKYFNMVRFRAGLPGLTDPELNSPATMQALIERERMVELLHEGARYHDVRRWGIYEASESEPIMGMNTDASGAEYYQKVSVNHSSVRNRVVDKKMILYPIELNEVRKAPSLDQNPGWQY